MLSIYPVFFPCFKCKADACSHTCCQIWEIDIDPDSEARYRSEKGLLGEELAQWMQKSEDGSTCFKLNDEGYCHFLTKEGLCRLFLEKGDDYLCDICKMHPRFFKYIDDWELCGTGLSCERTVEQIMEEKGSLTFRADKADGFYSLEDLVNALGWDMQTSAYVFRPSLEEKRVKTVLSRLEKTEPIDEAWTDRLSLMTRKTDSLIRLARAYLSKYDPYFFNRLYQYIWYRALDESDAYGMAAVSDFARDAAEYIFLEAALTDDPIRSAARWSHQVEYDTKNPAILLNLIANAEEEGKDV